MCRDFIRILPSLRLKNYIHKDKWTKTGNSKMSAALKLTNDYTAVAVNHKSCLTNNSVSFTSLLTLSRNGSGLVPTATINHQVGLALTAEYMYKQLVCFTT